MLEILAWYFGIGLFVSVLVALTIPKGLLVPKTKRDFIGLGLCLVFWPWLLFSLMLED